MLAPLLLAALIHAQAAPAPPQDTVLIRGQVREADTHQPVPNVEVRFFAPGWPQHPPPTRTDAQGRYETSIPRGKVAPYVPAPPSPLLPTHPPAEFGRRNSDAIPPDVAEHTFPPIDLVRGRMLAGEVVDDAGQPVPGARVWASWTGPFAVPYRGTNATATAGPDGRFTLGPVDPTSDTHLRAARGPAATGGASIVGSTEIDYVGPPIRLVVSPVHTVAASARVVDESGQPIAGATVRVWGLTPLGNSFLKAAIDFPTGDPTTGPDGRATLPSPLMRDGEFQLQVEAPGRLPGETPWTKPGTEPSFAFPDVVLRPLPTTRSLAGRVIDRAGNPVKGIEISASATDQAPWITGADGRFRLAEVPAGPAFLIAREDRRVLTGTLIPADQTGDVTITLGAAEPLVTLGPALPRDQELALVRRLLDLYVDRAAREAKTDADRYRYLARLDPARILEALDTGAVTEPGLADALRWFAANAIAPDDPDEALTIVEAMTQPDDRARGLLLVASHLPDSEQARKLGLLDRAIPEARAATDPPGTGPLWLAKTAEQYLDLGHRDRAEPLLREAAAAVAPLPGAGPTAYYRGAVAEELAQVDLPAALDLVAGISEVQQSDANRHYGNIAHELAATNPPEAERVLALVNQHQMHLRDRHAIRVAYRMAKTDLPRARRVAAAIETDPLRAYALGLIAQARAEDGDTQTAATLLEEAFAILEKRDYSSLYLESWSAPAIAGALLPVAERIDPSRARPYLWRALALRRKPIGPGRGADWADAHLALGLARYDRALARALVEPLLDAPPAPSFGPRAWDRRNLPYLSALIDPAWAVDLIEAMPEDPEAAWHLPKNLARARAANLLTRQGERRYRSALHDDVVPWLPDLEDLDEP